MLRFELAVGGPIPVLDRLLASEPRSVDQPSHRSIAQRSRTKTKNAIVLQRVRNLLLWPKPRIDSEPHRHSTRSSRHLFVRCEITRSPVQSRLRETYSECQPPAPQWFESPPAHAQGLAGKRMKGSGRQKELRVT